MEPLVDALKRVESDNAIPDGTDDDVLPNVEVVQALAMKFLTNKDGSLRCDDIDTLWKRHGYFIYPYGRRAALRTKKGIIVFG